MKLFCPATHRRDRSLCEGGGWQQGWLDHSWTCHWSQMCWHPGQLVRHRGVLHFAVLGRNAAGLQNQKRCFRQVPFPGWTALPLSWVCDSSSCSALAQLCWSRSCPRAVCSLGLFPPEKALGKSFLHVSGLQLLFCKGIGLEGTW